MSLPVRSATLLALLALAAASLFVGVIDMAPSQLLRDSEALKLMAVSRLPRTLAVVLTGATLAVAGVIMQMLARNRFVEPTTAGTGQSAALGILLATLYAPDAPLVVKMGFASLTALLGSGIFLLIVRRLPVTQPLLVPLVGLVYGAIIGAGVTFLAYRTDLLQYVSIWLNGEFSGVIAGRYEFLFVSGIAAVIAYLAADRFSILGLGRDASISLGLNYNQMLLLGLVVVSVITALTVVNIGMIPFVGLVVPNIASRLLGDNLRSSLPFVAASGAGLVLICDIVGRIVRHPYEIPVGTVFGVVGAVIFLWLLYAKRPSHG